MSIATPKLGPLPNPFLYDGYILPAIRLHDPDFGSPFDYPKPVTGTGTIPSQPYKDADENSRVRFRHLVNTGQAVTGTGIAPLRLGPNTGEPYAAWGLD